MTSNQIDELLGLLEKERQAALTVDLDGLADFAKQKELKISQLDISVLNSENSEKVGSELRRNQAILAAMIKGVQSARNHLKQSYVSSGEVNIYNKSGSLQVVCEPQMRNSKKF